MKTLFYFLAGALVGSLLTLLISLALRPQPIYQFGGAGGLPVLIETTTGRAWIMQGGWVPIAYNSMQQYGDGSLAPAPWTARERRMAEEIRELTDAQVGISNSPALP